VYNIFGVDYMRLSLVKSKNAIQYYIIESYRDVNGKNTSRIIEKLGNEQEVIKKANGEDPVLWAKKYIEELNKKEKEESKDIIIKKSQKKQIEKNEQNLFNCGYLFLQDIYNELKIDNICKKISSKYKFKYDLNNILSRLVYSRIIYPSSKLATYELSTKFIEQPNFDLQNIYRALEIISKENDLIQSEIYKNSLNVYERNSSILYYDCTNYFFEIEESETDSLRQYGPSKEHRPNPITQMGLFMDGSGIPLAFNINPGNTNEQKTLTPLEKQIEKDFKLSEFIVCTDAGLASNDNRIFNNKENKAFITTQSIKKIKKHLKEWALDSKNWKLSGSKKIYNIDEFTEEENKKYEDKIFYKERWINEDGLEQKFIVTYSIKYKKYQQKIRQSQIERAKKAILTKGLQLDKCNQNDYKRFITKTNITPDGEVADKKIFSINYNLISQEEQYDGYYGVCTNLDDSPEEIIKINKKRWEIEESFRIMKSEFKARPVYLSKDERIKAHFMTCYIALLIHRILEKKLNEEYTCHEIIDCLRNMNLVKEKDKGYIPAYTRTDLTDALHDKFNFRTDYEITSIEKMKKIFKQVKK